jgi:hypothetical protein
MMHTYRLTACLILVAFVGCGRQSSAPSANTLAADTQITRTDNRVDVVSKVYHVDKIYPSMLGPWSRVNVPLLDQPKPELVWITGAHVKMLDAAGQKAMPDEFMCHANLDLDGQQHCKQMGLSKYLDGRLFTLSQGQLVVNFPKGTGIPVRSDLPLSLVTQVLNLNVLEPNFDIRHHVTIDFIRDRDVKGTMIPLYESGVSTQVTLEDNPLAFDIMDHGTGSQLMGMCIPGQKANDSDEHEDRYGRRFTGHWVVPPGRQEAKTRCTSIMNLPFDTKVYAIAVHMHPYAESLELRDVSVNKTLFKSTARNFEGKIGLEAVDSFESAEGLPVYKNHEYELVCKYNNTSEKPVDSMAVMYLYLGDTEFDRAEAMRRLASDAPLQKIATEATSNGSPRM